MEHISILPILHFMSMTRSYDISIKRRFGIGLSNMPCLEFCTQFSIDILFTISRRFCWCVRLDDFIICGLNPESLNAHIGTIKTFLETVLQLQLHPNKIILRKYRAGIDFLGYVVLPYHRMLRTKTKKRVINKVSDKSLRSYLGVVSHCNGYGLKQEILRIFENRV